MNAECLMNCGKIPMPTIENQKSGASSKIIKQESNEK
jgi:hypothetical protein